MVSWMFRGVAVCGVLCLAGCSGSRSAPPGGAPGASNDAAVQKTVATKPSDDGFVPSGNGTEKEKPAPGKGSVQGKVFFNEKPAPGVEVKLAEKFSRFIGGANGATFTTKTDGQGEYLIKNVPPGVYEGLLVRVFDSNSYVFATSGIISAAKYKIEPDKTYFAPDTNLFKGDLKLISPKAGAKVPPSGIEVQWKPYPDAAYYKFSINGDSSTGAKTEYDYVNKRVDGASYVLDKPLTAGSYSVTVTAYNANDRKLAESSHDIKFLVKG